MVPKDSTEDLDDILDDLDDDLDAGSSEETPAPKKGGAKKSAPAKSGSKKSAPKNSETQKKASAKKSTAKKEKADDGEAKVEGLTKETVETGIITFKKGSGSANLLTLIRKFGFDREKVLKAAAQLKEKGKGFKNCDPAKKYGKVAGIIKRLQGLKYKLELEG